MKYFRTLRTFHQADEKGSLIRLGQCLPGSVWRNQATSHTSTCSCNSSI